MSYPCPVWLVKWHWKINPASQQNTGPRQNVQKELSLELCSQLSAESEVELYSHVALPMPLTLYSGLSFAPVHDERFMKTCPCQIIEKKQTEVLKDRYVPSAKADEKSKDIKKNPKSWRKKKLNYPIISFQVKWKFYMSLSNFFFLKWVKALSLIWSLQVWYIR